MSKVKGCINNRCVANKKKIRYPESEKFCSKCGQPLSYVCKKCYTPIESSEKYCVIHQAEKDDHADKMKKKLLCVGPSIAGVVVLTLTKGKEIVKYIPKIK